MKNKGGKKINKRNEMNKIESKCQKTTTTPTYILNSFLGERNMEYLAALLERFVFDLGW